MKFFGIASLIYVAIAIIIVVVFRDDPLQLLSEKSWEIPGSVKGLAVGLWWAPLVIAGLLYGRSSDILTTRLVPACGMLLLCVLFHFGFMLIKTTLPFMQPFYADPFLADVDNFLHFGNDPWALVQWMPDALGVWLGETFYLDIWIPLAFGFPAILVLFDQDEERKMKFFKLHIIAWAGIGSLLALFGMSGGPVYYDGITGTDRFAGLTAALAANGISDSTTGDIHMVLWYAYQHKAQALGSGISAFPSVHLSVVTMICLYVHERWSRFLPAIIGVWTIYQFLSVYLGWHYAVDGYFSTAVMIGAWYWLSKRQNIFENAQAAQPANPTLQDILQAR